jgi:hypothetical protein
MAKRFISNEIFEDSWFSDLPSKYKLFWVFLITKCNHTGIWEVNFRNANHYVGEHIEQNEAKRYLKERIVEIRDGRYWFIPKFVTFQYKENLSYKNNAHRQIIDNISKYDLLQYLPETIILDTNKPLTSPSRGAQDKDKDKDKEMVKEKDKENCEKPKKSQNEFDYSIIHSEVLESVIKFVQFRKDIKKPFVNQEQLVTWYNKLRKLSNNNIPIAIEIISNSIASGYQGIFAINEKPNYQKPSGEGMNIDELLKRQIA